MTAPPTRAPAAASADLAPAMIAQGAPDPQRPTLALVGVTHAFLGREVLRDVTLTVGAGEVLALVGPSGCGKSTLIHLAAGLLHPKSGRIERHFTRQAMVFQEPRLLPWATARANIAYAARLARLARPHLRDAVTRAAARAEFALEDLDKFPVELSGGMRQRVAIARALVTAPDFVFFDEPFTALDVALKRRLQDVVIAETASGRFGTLFVTHDLIEAARIAHRIAVMHPEGAGIMGTRRLPGVPGGRDDDMIHALARRWEREDPLFRHIHDVDERRLA